MGLGSDHGARVMRALSDGDLDVLREIERDCRDDGDVVEDEPEMPAAELAATFGPCCGQCGEPLDYATGWMLCPDCACDLHIATIDG